jgi:ribosomal protein S18 acetylase RimI-like enzyme
MDKDFYHKTKKNKRTYIKKQSKTFKKKSKTNLKTTNSKTRQKLIKYWRNFGFPYVKNYINSSDMFKKYKNMLNNENYRRFIKNDKYELREQFNTFGINLKFANKFYSIFIPLSYYKEFDILIDYYTEHSRIMVKKNDKDMSLIEHYDKGTLLKDAIDKLIKLKREINIESLRDIFYDFPNIYNASPESTMFYMCLINILFYNQIGKYNDLVIIDGAGGYGCRLLAAILLDSYYFGVEPNSVSTPGFKNMIQELGDRYKHNMFEDGLPTAKGILDIEDNIADIIFFSPPLFGGEIYSEDEKQSILMFKDLYVWKTQFLHKSLEVLWSKLKPNHYIVFQSMRYDYILEYMNTLKDAKFEGVISRKTYAGRFKPNWIWSKIQNKLDFDKTDIKLKKFTELADCEIKILSNILSNPDIMKYVGTGDTLNITTLLSTIENEKNILVSNNSFHNLYDAILIDNKLIGCVSLVNYDLRNDNIKYYYPVNFCKISKKTKNSYKNNLVLGEISYSLRVIIDKPYQHRGIASIVMEKVLDLFKNLYFKDTKEIINIVGWINIKNISGIKLFEKFKFKKIGLFQTLEKRFIYLKQIYPHLSN